MIEIGKRRIYFGDFHGQWNGSKEDIALLLSGLSWHGYDFTVFQSPDKYAFLKENLKSCEMQLDVIPGHECMYEWAHLTTAQIKEGRPRLDNPNLEEVLSWHMANTAWTIMAHPYEFMIDKLNSLLDKKLLSAVELVNGHKNSDRNLKLVDWYYESLKKGEKIPIVSGLDIHIPHGSRRPNILYTEAYLPEEDIDLFGANRTGVISEGASVPEIKAAIANCQTFVEIEEEKLLIGPPEIVKRLQDEGYWEAVEKDLAARRRLAPKRDAIIKGGVECSLDYKSEIDDLTIAEKKYKSSAVNIPLTFSRNTFYLNLKTRKDEAELVSALKVYHPLNVELKGVLRDGNCETELFVSNALERAVKNINAKIRCGDQETIENIHKIGPNQTEVLKNKWDIKEGLRPSRFEIELKADDGIQKDIVKHLVFFECKYIDNIDNAEAWKNMPPIDMTGRFAEQIDEAYTVEWKGDSDLSARIRMAWNEKAVYFKLNIIDDVLAPSKTNLLMFGDSFQIGLNPLSSEAVGSQSFYDIMMTRGTENGNEKAYMERPPQIALEYPIKSRLPLDGLYSGQVKGDEFEGILTLPRNMISPLNLNEGSEFGLYMIIFDNDGTGLKTSLQWPLSSEKYLNQAWYTPYGGAWANIRLTK